jgi:hypothetical protein
MVAGVQGITIREVENIAAELFHASKLSACAYFSRAMNEHPPASDMATQSVLLSEWGL